MDHKALRGGQQSLRSNLKAPLAADWCPIISQVPAQGQPKMPDSVRPKGSNRHLVPKTSDKLCGHLKQLVRDFGQRIKSPPLAFAVTFLT